MEEGGMKSLGKLMVLFRLFDGNREFTATIIDSHGFHSTSTDFST
jgi:hypothetical protein